MFLQFIELLSNVLSLTHPLYSSSHSMEPQVTLNVTFKNETQSFLVSDPENTTWADVEAMVSVVTLFCFSIL